LPCTDPNGNRVMMPPESVRQIVNQCASRIDGVLRADSTVRGTDEGVIIDVNALLAPDTHIVEKSSELNDCVRKEMQERVGVKVEALRMNLELARSSDLERENRPRRWGQRREEIHSPR
jgi:uncharacterized alkaline shock family protein YloU